GGYIISTEGGSPTNHGYSLRLSGSKLQFSFGDGSGWPGITTSTDIVPKTWFHAAVTYSGTQVTMYINGVQAATAIVATPMVASPDNVILGDSPTWTNRCFNGIMSDFRFWNVVRTQTDIATDMTNSLTGTETGLVAGWKMNEGTGTSVADVKAVFPITISSNVAWYPATAITVSGTAISTDGGTTQMAATINGNATAARNITWAVSDPKIATINADGLLSARKNGTVTVTATATDGSGVNGTVQVVVSNQIAPVKQVFVDFGLSTGTTPVGADSYGNYWNNSSDPAITAAAVALVDNTNVASGFNLYVTAAFQANGPTAGGLTTPIASYLGEFAIATATQDYFYATAGALKITGLNVNKGYRFKLFGSRDNTETRKTQFVFTGSNSVTTTELQTSGSNIGGTGINGNNSTILRSDLIYPTTAGEITIAVNKIAGSFAHLNIMKIEEFDKIAVTGITVSGNAISNLGGTSQLTASVLPANATLKDVAWSVNNPNVATISSTGLLTANGNGTVTATATSKDGSNVTGSVQIVVSNQPTPVKQALIDFGPATQSTLSKLTVSPDVTTNYYWNNYTGDVVNSTATLVDKANASTGITITTLTAFSVNATPGAPGLESTNALALGDLSVANATLDYFFTQSTASMKFSGLNINRGYKFYAFGCRLSSTDTRVSQYTFTGAVTTVGTLKTSEANLGGTGIHGNNSSLYITPIIYPDANGEIKLDMTSTQGGYAYLNDLKLEEYNMNVATGLDKNSADIKVFPVVFNDKVSVKGATKMVELFNSTGVKVLSQPATSETSINTSNLPKGVYVLVVDKKQSYKLIK
ncbi:MAG TPA: Ig-like domain-containing protein, partial [Paludibacter sp.]